MCRPQLGALTEADGTPVAAASANATAAVPAASRVCTLAAGCTANLTNSNMYEVAGVAMDRGGNCWVGRDQRRNGDADLFQEVQGIGSSRDRVPGQVLRRS
jgi:hypothetical protein